MLPIADCAAKPGMRNTRTPVAVFLIITGQSTGVKKSNIAFA
jgi:hypothetical protein